MSIAYTYRLLFLYTMTNHIRFDLETKTTELRSNGNLITNKKTPKAKKYQVSICFKSGKKMTQSIVMKQYDMERERR